MPSGPDKHLFICISEEDNHGYAIFVNVSSFDEDDDDCDLTCILEKGEHCFIRRKSFAAYSYAIQIHKGTIENQLSSRVIIAKEKATDNLVQKIQAGIKSHRTPRRVKDGYDACIRAEKRREREREKKSSQD